jgi:predicted transcriptional regulator
LVKGAQITTICIGANLDLFKILADKNGEPASVKELAEKTGADYLLISMLAAIITFLS